MFIYFSIIYFIEQAVTTHGSSDTRVNKADVIHTYNGLSSNLKGADTVSQYSACNTNEPRDSRAGWNRPGTEGQIAYNHSYDKIPQ